MAILVVCYQFYWLHLSLIMICCVLICCVYYCACYSYWSIFALRLANYVKVLFMENCDESYMAKLFPYKISDKHTFVLTISIYIIDNVISWFVWIKFDEFKYNFRCETDNLLVNDYDSEKDGATSFGKLLDHCYGDPIHYRHNSTNPGYAVFTVSYISSFSYASWFL